MAEIKVEKVTDEFSKQALPIFKEMESVFDRIRVKAFDLFARRGFGEGHALEDWLAAEREICWPAGELVEENNGVTLRVALPGFEAEDISITATPHRLVVHAKSVSESQKDQKSKKSKTICWSEFRDNDVYRQVDLPRGIDPQSVSASLHNGLLKIVATRAAKPTPAISSASVVESQSRQS